MAAITTMARTPGPSAAELDAVTLEACRVGDAAALRAFVVRYQRLVFAFVSRTLGPGPHVEDLSQEVFLRAMRALPRFDPARAARPSTWLLTIAIRLVIDERRKRRLTFQPLETDTEALASQAETPETERHRAELGQALMRAAFALSEEQRDVFVLAEFHGLDMREIGEVLGIPEATAKTRLFRARERLRVLLQSVWENP